MRRSQSRTAPATGALVPLEDLEAWVAAIKRLRDDPEAVQVAREIAVRRAQRFRYDAMIAGFDRVLTSDG